MKIKIVILSSMLLLSLSTAYAQTICPNTNTKLEKYIEVPMLPNLEKDGALKSALKQIDTFEKDINKFVKYKLKIHFKMVEQFKKSKETLIILPGGPGPYSILHRIHKAFPFLSKKYNLIEMSHRGTGCSQKKFHEDQPYFSYYMRFAAFDINQIRKYLYGENSTKKINIYGSSYGSFLAQQFLVMYPHLVNRTYLRDTLSDIQSKGYYNNKVRLKNIFLKYYKNNLLILNTLKNLSNDKLNYFFKKIVRPWRKGNGRNITAPKVLKKLNRKAPLSHSDSELTNTMTSNMVNSINCNELYVNAFQKNIYINSRSQSICQIYQKNFKYEPFNFLKLLKDKPHKVIIVNGQWDLVTPMIGAIKTHKSLKNSILVSDQNSGHGELNSRNIDCHTQALKHIFFDQPLQVDFCEVK